MPLHEDEAAFIRSFVNPDRQERWLSALASEKHRDKILHRLADARDLRPERMTLLDRQLNSPDAIWRHFAALGAKATCHALSEDATLDGRDLSSTEALQECVGQGLGTVISFLPGRLCFFEEETPGKRWVLRA